MANKGFKTIAGTIDIPSNLTDFKNRDQVVWTGSNWRTKGAFTPTHGDTVSWPHDPSYGFARRDNMYSPQQSSGLKLSSSAGNQHEGNYELYGDGRWMSASVFNGVGFEVYQNSGSKHAVYLRKYALVFANRDDGTYRTWGVDTGVSSPSTGYRFIRVVSSASMVSTIRNWGPYWQFQGLILHMYNNGGAGSDDSYIEVYNMKVGSKFSSLGGQYRYIPAGKRSYANRKIIPVNNNFVKVGLTNPFS